MKTDAPKDLAQYLRVTEHATKHLYSGLDSCWAHYQEALVHWDISQAGKPMTPEKRAGLNRYLNCAGKYFDLKFSEAMFAGAILQHAYMAIRLFSRNSVVPPACATFIRSRNTSVIPFCIGPLRCDIPTGLIVYAARNQFNHWDEEKPHQVTKAVFQSIATAFKENPMADLAFELSNPTIHVFANEILLTALDWKSYDTYLTELTGILTSEPKAAGT